MSKTQPDVIIECLELVVKINNDSLDPEQVAESDAKEYAAAGYYLDDIVDEGGGYYKFVYLPLN